MNSFSIVELNDAGPSIVENNLFFYPQIFFRSKSWSDYKIYLINKLGRYQLCKTKETWTCNQKLENGHPEAVLWVYEIIPEFVAEKIGLINPSGEFSHPMLFSELDCPINEFNSDMK